MVVWIDSVYGYRQQIKLFEDHPMITFLWNEMKAKAKTLSFGLVFLFIFFTLSF